MSTRPTAKYCWACGSVAKPGAKFCTTCGKALSKKIQATAGKNPSKNLEGKTVKLPNEPVSRDKPSAYSTGVRREEEAKTVVPKYSSPFATPSRSNTPMSTSATPSITKKDFDNSISNLRNDFSDFQTKMESTISGLYGERFEEMEKTLERLEYKVNAFNVENRITDLENAFEKLNIKAELEEMNAKITSTPTKLDLENTEKRMKKDILGEMEKKFANLEAKVEEFSADAEIQHLEEKLDEKIDNMELDARFVRLEDRIDTVNPAKRITQLEEDIGDRLKISSTDLEAKIDSVNLKMTEQFTKIDESMKTLIPALVELTKRVNEMSGNQKVTSSGKSPAKSTSSKSKAKPVKEGVKKPSDEKEKPADLDLPPFPKKAKPKTKTKSAE